MFGGLSTNYSEGGQSQRRVEPSAQRASAPTQVRTNEGKTAKSLVGFLDKMSFDTRLFSQLLISEAGNGLRKRVFNIAVDIIREYASQWETGLYQDEVARDAMRLKDTLDQFRM